MKLFSFGLDGQTYQVMCVGHKRVLIATINDIDVVVVVALVTQLATNITFRYLHY